MDLKCIHMKLTKQHVATFAWLVNFRFLDKCKITGITTSMTGLLSETVGNYTWWLYFFFDWVMILITKTFTQGFHSWKFTLWEHISGFQGKLKIIHWTKLYRKRITFDYVFNFANWLSVIFSWGTLFDASMNNHHRSNHKVLYLERDRPSTYPAVLRCSANTWQYHPEGSFYWDR